MGRNDTNDNDDDNNKDKEADRLISRILHASNHYQVLDLSQDATLAQMRKAYLKTSVRVHPDKCGHPDTVPAFQRVAAAWQVLSDPQQKAEYDRELLHTRTRPSSSPRHHSDIPNDESAYTAAGSARTPSMQEALFVFCTVAGMMGGKSGNVAADMAQSLYWAEQWMQQEEEDRSRQSGGNPEVSSSTRSKAHAAMAVGSGLRVASAAAAALGMRGSAATLQRGAQAAQLAGVGALVAEQTGLDTAVQGALQSESVRKLRGSWAVVRELMKHGGGEERNGETTGSYQHHS